MPEWKGFNYGMHDLSTRQPNADGNPLSFLFDTNGESEVHGRDCIIKKNVGQVCSLSLSLFQKKGTHSIVGRKLTDPGTSRIAEGQNSQIS